jgi:hypothetical protein
MMRYGAVALLLLAGCGPISVQQAEKECFERARLAQQPRGQVGVGINSDGNVGGNAEITVTSDFILGRDPSAVFDTCVVERSGQLPTRSLTSFPAWRS